MNNRKNNYIQVSEDIVVKQKDTVTDLRVHLHRYEVQMNRIRLNKILRSKEGINQTCQSYYTGA